MPNSITADLAFVAYESVRAAKASLDASACRSYETLAAELPFLIRENGLVQTLSFLAGKAKRDPGTRRLAIEFNEALGEVARKAALLADARGYIAATAKAAALAGYWKRFAESATPAATPTPDPAGSSGSPVVARRSGLLGRNDANHAGLLLAYGLMTHDANKQDDAGSPIDKKALIRRVTEKPAPALYKLAFQRWKSMCLAARAIRTCCGRIDPRMYIGLGGADVLETHVTLNRVFGVPMIPGSAQKGLARAYARRLEEESGNDKAKAKKEIDWLFGAGSDDEASPSGQVVFHDAWWIPGDTPPLAEEIVTIHHQDYYGSEGRSPASDMDEPVPAPQVAVRGAFLFAVEAPDGNVDAAEVARDMLARGLKEWGLGAKTGSGYGYFAVTD